MNPTVRLDNVALSAALPCQNPEFGHLHSPQLRLLYPNGVSSPSPRLAPYAYLGLGFHPHLHCLVPGAGLHERGRFVRVRKPEYLLHVPLLQAAFREHLRRLFQVHDWQVDPDVWGKEWGVHIQPAGNGGGERTRPRVPFGAPPPQTRCAWTC
jgi:hypothetical protein